MNNLAIRISVLFSISLVATFICIGNGNRLVAVTNEVEEAVYNRKGCHDLNTEGNDFGYDANGNLIYDLDRDIVTIRYNLLNLPDTVQFQDGRQIVNRYAADGRKLTSTGYTPLETMLAPLAVGEVARYNTTTPPGNTGNKLCRQQGIH